MEKNKEKNNFLIKIGDFITNFRYLFLAIFIGLFIIGLININNVDINNSIVSYLPDDTETKYGLDIMEEEFGNLTTIKLMIKNISTEELEKISTELSKIENIDNISNEYKENNVLYTIEIINKTDDEIDQISDNIKSIVDNNESYIYSEYLDNPTEGIDIVLILAVIVIIVILLITSKTYFEPVIAFIIFAISIILNMGSNFLLGEISYITKSIAVILQLALSIDYVIIFMNQYMKEISDTDNKILAIKKTISKTIPEIFASSLTTISGLMALVFMHLKIGGDIGIVLSKGILCSLLTVILIMPSLLDIFSNIIIKLKRKEKNIDLNKLSNFIVSSRKVLLPVFLTLVIISIFLIPKYNYVYNSNSTNSIRLSDNVKSLQEIEKEFGKDNMLVILVKNENKDYNTELELVKELKIKNEINKITSIGSYELNDNLYLGSNINYQEFSSIFNINKEISSKLYQLYAKENNQLEKLSNIDDYKITIINLIYFLKNNENNLPLSNEIKYQINMYYASINESINLLESDNYTRFILNLDLTSESEETKESIDEIRKISEKYYDDVTLVGNSINAIDLESTFTSDNLIITDITILFIAIILMFTFKSFGMTLLLILTIEGSILINFGITALCGREIFFMSYVIVSAIQMGATIDYAIVIASRYKELRKKFDKKEAIIGTLSDRLPAVMTSGLILLIAGFLIGIISTSPVISSIGLSLGIGTLISLISTIFVLPAILYVSDKFIKLTTFGYNKNGGK